MTDFSVDTLINKLITELAPLFVDEENQPIIVGIETGGYWIAQAIYEKFQPSTELGKLNITFYRDDYTKIGLHPTVKPSCLPTNIDGSTIILVDDVLHSGRTIRAAMNELFDYGRPEKIILAILIEREGRELPIQADYVAQSVKLAHNEQIKIEGPHPFKLSIHPVESL